MVGIVGMRQAFYFISESQRLPLDSGRSSPDEAKFQDCVEVRIWMIRRCFGSLPTTSLKRASFHCLPLRLLAGRVRYWYVCFTDELQLAITCRTTPMFCVDFCFCRTSGITYPVLFCSRGGGTVMAAKGVERHKLSPDDKMPSLPFLVPLQKNG